jgi:hypothetical protein
VIDAVETPFKAAMIASLSIELPIPGECVRNF